MSRRRRHFSRVRAQSLVAHLHLDGKLVGGGAVENISAGGLLVRTGQQLPEGAALQLDLVRPGMKKPFRLPGFVVGQGGGQGGVPPALRIRFDLSADATSSRLHVLLSELGLRELTEPPAPLPPLVSAAPRAAQARAPVLPGPPVLVPQRTAVPQVLSSPGAAAPARGGLPSLAPSVPPAASVRAAAAGPVLPEVAVPEAPVQAQLQALREELQQARAQLARHEAELAALRAQLRAQRP